MAMSFRQQVRWKVRRAALPLALMLCATAPSQTARADGPTHPSIFDLRLHGYGEMAFAFRAYGENQNRPTGSQRDRRLEFDTTRFVAALEGFAPGGWELEAEVEFEHGGTGAAREIEYEEFGEYETEVEKGGEVIIEEFYLRKTFGGRYSVKAGRFYVGFGTLSEFYTPLDYVGTHRSEAEETVIPAQWDEMGVSFEARFPRAIVTAQVVNGLDSTGFSSKYFVASGHQQAYETIKGTDLAGVLRLDVPLDAHSVVGVAGYAGGTSKNRPKSDLVKSCDDGDTDVVAACGYVKAPLYMAEAHAKLALGGFHFLGTAMWGYLKNAKQITERNSRLSNNAGVARTPVASQAYAAWAEAGYDVAPLLGWCQACKTMPFVRVDFYNTMFKTAGDLFENPRFARRTFTAGIAHTIRDAIAIKLSVDRRFFGSDELRPETSGIASLGFVY